MKRQHFWLSLAIAMAANSMSAQNSIKGAGTDEKFANTTVVYKDSTTSDQAILAQLNDSNLGIGDVIRITTPPPPAKATSPIMVKKVAVTNTVNNNPKALPKPVPSTSNANLLASTDNPSLMLESLQTTSNTPPDPIRPTSTRKVVVPRITPALVENDRETTRTITTKTAAKSAKSGKSVRSEKSARKSNKSSAAHRTAARKYKPRGKQQYGCYHF